jgi:hypothetical protein
VAIRVASAAAIVSATSPPVGPMVGASAVAASAARVAMRDDLAIAASSCGAVATLRGSAGRCASMVGIGRQLSSSTVTTEVRTATCCFIVAIPEGRWLSDPGVDSHEVGVFRELGDDLSRAHPLGLMCYRSDRHEALLWGSVYPALDLVECFSEVADGQGVAETSALFVPLSIAFTSASLLAGVSSAGALADNSSAEMSSRYWSGTVPEGPGISLVVMKTCQLGEPRLESLVATSVGVCSLAGASGVPSWKGSESR